MRELNPAFIAINFGGKHYIITSEVFWAEKTYLHFKGQGFELQCFIKMSVFFDRGTWQKIDVAPEIKKRLKKPPLGIFKGE
jgi:hypothetical protein